MVRKDNSRGLTEKAERERERERERPFALGQPCENVLLLGYPCELKSGDKVEKMVS